MEQDLISKKELLKITDISYGQLYRWRRKKLIPEQWFIRKSVFTGQETFFPKEKIIKRVEKIKKKRKDYSLDEMADLFSSSPMNLSLAKTELIEKGIVSQTALQKYIQYHGDELEFPFKQILYMFVFDQLLVDGEITSSEGSELLQLLSDHYTTFAHIDGQIIITRKMGITSFFMMTKPTEFVTDEQTNMIVQLSLSNCASQLKQKLID